MDTLDSCCALGQERASSLNDVFASNEVKAVERPKEIAWPAWRRALEFWYSTIPIVCFDPKEQEMNCEPDWEVQHTPEHTPEHMPEHTPEHTSEHTSERKPELHFDVNAFEGGATLVTNEALETKQVLEQITPAAQSKQTGHDQPVSGQTQGVNTQAEPSQCTQNNLDCSDQTPVQRHLNRLRKICNELTQHVNQDKCVCDRFDRRVERAQAFWAKMIHMQRKATERYIVRSSQLLKVMAAITHGEHVKTLTLQADAARVALQCASENLVQVQAAFDAAAAEVGSAEIG